MTGRVLTVALLLLTLALAVYAAWSAWGAAGEVEIGVHGLVAMLLGAVFTLGLAGGLIWLMLFSRRHGYDEAAADETAPPVEAARRRQPPPG